jgi:transposase
VTLPGGVLRPPIFGGVVNPVLVRDAAALAVAVQPLVRLNLTLRGSFIWRTERQKRIYLDGQALGVPVTDPGSNQTRCLFGALNIRTGQWSYLVREHMYKEDFVVFLEHLLTVYATGPIILIVDNYSSHTAKLVATWLDEHPRLQLHYLPKYCSHLNPVESIWLRLKERVAANRLHGSLDGLLEAVTKFFDAMTPKLALRWADYD